VGVVRAAGRGVAGSLGLGLGATGRVVVGRGFVVGVVFGAAV
jgi:hypothetical protein